MKINLCLLLGINCKALYDLDRTSNRNMTVISKFAKFGTEAVVSFI